MPTKVVNVEATDDENKKWTSFLNELDYYLESGTNTEKETECPVEIPDQISDNIFKPKNIRKGWKKNTNVPKFLVRVYLKYFSVYNVDKKDKKYYETHKKARK